jgi:hypothetical protein
VRLLAIGAPAQQIAGHGTSGSGQRYRCHRARMGKHWLVLMLDEVMHRYRRPHTPQRHSAPTAACPGG